jgi:putative ABC transport system permease protein
VTARTELPAPARVAVVELIREGVLALRGRPGRATLSALGVAIGVAALVAVLGIGAASRAGLVAQIDRLGTDMLTVSPGHNLFGGNAELPIDAESMVRRIDGVRSASAVGMISGATVRRTDRIDPQQTGGIAVQAARLDLLGSLSGRVSSGIYLSSANERYPVVVLGAVAAQRLGLDRAPVQAFIGGRWFTVIGVLEPLPLAPDVDRSALVGWTAAQQLLGFDGHPTTIYERSADEAVQRIATLLPGTVNPQHPGEVQVSRPSDALTAGLAAKSTFAALFLGLGAVALLVGGVGIANTMVISVLERRSEIGLRRALGARRAQVRAQFFIESVVLSVGGGVAGVLLGLIVSLGYALTRDWPLVVPAQTLAAGVLASVLVGSLAGLYPARRAARLTPTEALAAAT